jgi:hypothetical protein
MKGFIVYHVHGHDGFYQQARFSILSLVDLLRREGRTDIQILVYADRPKEFAHYPFTQTVFMSRRQVVAWSGPFRYVHRVKLEVLNHAIGAFGLPLLYVDGDTRWLRLPDAPMEVLATPRARGDAGVFYMHACEGALTPEAHGEYYRELTAQMPLLRAHGLDNPARWVMWNAGALGVPVGSEDLFKEALGLLDDLMKTTKATTYIEQALMSSLVSTRFEVEGLGDYIYHYWDTSKEVQAVLRRFFAPLAASGDHERELAAYDGFGWNSEDIAAIRRDVRHRARLVAGKFRRSVSKRWAKALAKTRRGAWAGEG